MITSSVSNASKRMKLSNRVARDLDELFRWYDDESNRIETHEQKDQEI